MDSWSFYRTAASEFIVPYWKFLKSLNHPFCVGMRFKIQYGSEDVNERSEPFNQTKILFSTIFTEF
jgi:hypothetical protein